MAKVTNGRMTADLEGDFVVFLIGMRINKLWKVHKWFPVAMAMPGMQREQLTDPEIGMLGQHQWFTGRRTLLVQYWRSSSDSRTTRRCGTARRGRPTTAPSAPTAMSASGTRLTW